MFRALLGFGSRLFPSSSLLVELVSGGRVKSVLQTFV